jgi:hypothetical protein
MFEQEEHVMVENPVGALCGQTVLQIEGLLVVDPAQPADLERCGGQTSATHHASLPTA